MTLDVSRWDVYNARMATYSDAMARFREESDDRSFAKHTGIPYSEVRERRLVQRMGLSEEQMKAYQDRIAGIDRRFDAVMHGR